jgi:hypothetical protein
VFERFTEAARLVVVRAQDEARELRHAAIGTEHLLLGLLGNDGTPAARALTSLGLDLPSVRGDVIALVGRGKASPVGHLEFTPRAKKIVELALRESLQLGGTSIAPEHLLLAITAEGQGVAMQILRSRAIDRHALWEALREVGVVSSVPPDESTRRDAIADAVAAMFEDNGSWNDRQPTPPTPPPPPFVEAVEALGTVDAGPRDGPNCPRCEEPLEGSLRVRAMEAEVATGGRIVVPIAYCGHCGAALEAVVRVSSESSTG